MSARETSDESRRKPLLTVLFWSGVGLAPMAALLLLVGDGNGPLRIAAVLAVLAVVLIGLSIALRGDADSVRVELEETLLEELDDLRGELRGEIATAARNTHRTLGERLDEVQGSVEALRGQLEAVRSGQDPGRVSAGAAVPVAAGAAAPAARDANDSAPTGRASARHAQGSAGPDRSDVAEGGRGRAAVTWADSPREEAVPAGSAGRRGGAARGAEYGSPRGAEYGSGRDDDRYPDDPRSPYDEDDHPDGRRRGRGRGRYERPDGPAAPGPGTYGHSGGGPEAYSGGAQWPPPGGAQHGATGSLPRLGPGVVQHTETVQVTTRHTIVGAADEDFHPGTVYGGGTYGTVYGGGRSGGTYGGGVYGGRGDRPDDRDVDFPDDRAEEPEERPRRGRRGGEPDEGGSGGRRFAGVRLGDFGLGEMPWRNRSAEPDPDLVTGDPADDSYWSELRSDDRWPAARDDDQGQELRMGQRRASVRADESGVEMRVEDRWAEVRHGDERGRSRRWSDADDEPGGPTDRSGAGRWGGDRDDRRPDPRAGRGRSSWDDPDVGRGSGRRGASAPALPAGGVDPVSAWAPSGAEWGPRRSPEPEPVSRGRRHRDDEEYGYPPDDEAPRAGGTRRSADYGYGADYGYR